jgi:hypothetical protein
MDHDLRLTLLDLDIRRRLLDEDLSALLLLTLLLPGLLAHLLLPSAGRLNTAQRIAAGLPVLLFAPRADLIDIDDGYFAASPLVLQNQCLQPDALILGRLLLAHLLALLALLGLLRHGRGGNESRAGAQNGGISYGYHAVLLFIWVS